MSWFGLVASAKDKLRSIFTFATIMSSDSGKLQFTIHDSNLALHDCLSTARPTKPALPAETILQILDHPSRWICTCANIFPVPDAPKNRPIIVSAGFDNHQANIYVILSTPPLSKEDITRARSIIFTFTSKDQGWSSYSQNHGTYGNTWSWFEAGLRPQTRGGYDPVARDDDLIEEEGQINRYYRFRLQSNRHAGREPESYRIEMGLDDLLLKKMMAGDVIDLLACTQYAGWQNQVHEAGIEILSFDDPRGWGTRDRD